MATLRLFLEIATVNLPWLSQTEELMVLLGTIIMHSSLTTFAVLFVQA
jgi:hypothetical protein